MQINDQSSQAQAIACLGFLEGVLTKQGPGGLEELEVRGLAYFISDILALLKVSP
jgi:hypothetical protein